MIRDQFVLDINQEIIVDNFAGGGGASTGIELALGRCVDVAINHDAEAIAMHSMNHPQTRHYCESVWDVDPLEVTQGRPVGLGWFSPDCKHFSKAKGGKPREKRIRGLAWVVLRWAALVRPRVIMLENVEEFRTWGPLLESGQPCPLRKGKTFRSFIHQLQEKGYRVEHRELRACDYGAPTIRKRLFLIARCDGQPIVWPSPTHGAPTSPDVMAGRLKPWRTAADCVDWSIPCPSIFERARPLAEATMKRIARGIRRYVLDSADPFIVKCNHTSSRTVYDCFRGSGIHEPLKTVTASHGMALVAPYLTEHANRSTQRNFPADEPLRTQCAEVKGGHFAVVAPTLVQMGYGEREGQAPRALDLGRPLGTVTAQGGKHALVSAFMAKHYGGGYEGAGAPLDGPAHTITTADHRALVTAHLVTNTTGHSGAAAAAPVPTLTTGGQQGLITAQLVGCGGRAGQSRPRDVAEPAQTLTAKADSCLLTSNLVKLRGQCTGSAADGPVATVTAGGTHVGEVRAFLVKYYGQGGQDQSAADPMHTIPTKDRMGLVTVAGQEYQIADIGMRMLEPHELYAAQGFPQDYIIAPTINGRRLPKHAQVRMCGNSVCPPLAAALVRANLPEMASWSRQDAKLQRIPA
nr:DNA cytosine methyltransferase [uncultured Achromobacter sp.]